MPQNPLPTCLNHSLPDKIRSQQQGPSAEAASQAGVLRPRHRPLGVVPTVQLRLIDLVSDEQ